MFYVNQLIIKQFKEFSHWIKEIKHYIKKIEEEHKITPEQVLKITNDVKQAEAELGQAQPKLRLRLKLEDFS